LASSEAKKERVRGVGEREMLSPRFSKRRPERCKSSREHWLHPAFKNGLGAGCAADLGSINRWSTAGRSEGLPKKRRSGSIWETHVEPRNRKKALKSETHECGELKKAFTSQKADTAERVAKP
jgi:hypothetical protein